jgi:hypothetical protein
VNNHHLINEGDQEAAIGAFLLAHEGHTEHVEIQRGTWSVYCYCAACGDLHTYEVDNEARERAIGLPAWQEEEHKKPPVQLLQTTDVAQHHQPATIAILGSNTVGRSTLCVLLEGSGYDTTLLDGSPTGVVDGLLEGAHLLLITPRVDEGVREAFLSAVGKSTSQVGDMPVIELSTALEENLPEREGILRVPWPCERKVLVERIEAALVDGSAASRASTADTA